MKLWSSFVKELTIALRGFYFYIEIAMAFIMLLLLLFVVPEQFNSKENEYLYLDFPTASIKKSYIEAFEDLDGQPEVVTLKVEKNEINTLLYETANKKIYLLESEEDMILLAENKHEIGAAVTMDEGNYEMHYTYYLQGNETDRLKSLLMIIHGQDDELLSNAVENQEIRSLSNAGTQLTDRENLLPVFLTFNGALMGFFIIAAYIFLDKKEGVIKAYAVTPSPVWKYLLSKVMVLTTTMLLTSLVIIVPLMGMRINYLMLLAFLIPTGLFASGLGLMIAGYYNSMVKSFGVMYLIMIAMGIPVLAYFSPSWDPLWLKFIPSYYIVSGFKEIFINGDMGFVLLIALGYLAAAVLLFAWSNARFKRTLLV
ncbi:MULTISPECIES: ABC transporter permease [unclassified Sedimentibacter]|uniref:ABC transporter permease n=1 Tax=unclassified Sedimentibacter TaxID=2649220 RepID=UPI0027DF0311|nr:ABC transporter permease [Sedimentibacter sp. MB35-C1]WMJ77475.1 ABC transporter permease [Sedimentibacter sp. MB35-C1]